VLKCQMLWKDAFVVHWNWAYCCFIYREGLRCDLRCLVLRPGLELVPPEYQPFDQVTSSSICVTLRRFPATNFALKMQNELHILGVGL